MSADDKTNARDFQAMQPRDLPRVSFIVEASMFEHAFRECSPWVCTCGRLADQIARTQAMEE